MTIPIRAIALGATDHGVLCGMTGSGKTTLAKELCARRSFVLAYDWKGNLRWPGFARFTRLASIVKSDPRKMPRVIYSPMHKELRDLEMQEAFFRFAWERKNPRAPTLVYIDEASAVMDANHVPTSLMDILARGRELGVHSLISTQRPMRSIPLSVLSESDCVWTFRLQQPGDRKRVAEATAIGALPIARLPKRSFYFYRAGADRAEGPLKLNLRKAAPADVEPVAA